MVYDDILEGYYGKHSEIKPVKSTVTQSRNFTTSGMKTPIKDIEEPDPHRNIIDVLSQEQMSLHSVDSMVNLGVQKGERTKGAGEIDTLL